MDEVMWADTRALRWEVGKRFCDQPTIAPVMLRTAIPR
jgi:hypothetical protein